MLILQLGSTVYSPRTVSYFLRARSTQVILAVFVTTITYSFAAMISIGSAHRTDFAPLFTVLGALTLLVASLIGFIALLQITGSRVRVDQLLTDLSRVATDRLPERIPVATDRHVMRLDAEVAPPADLTVVRYLGRPGQLVALDHRGLLRAARRAEGYLRLTTRIGDGILPGDTIGVVDARLPDQDRAISRCLVVSVERSLQHDPLYALRLLVDIAIRALSPAVNDPTTAVRSLDEIEAVLRAAAALPLGQVRLQVGRAVVVFDPPSWEDFLELGLLEIIEFGASQPQIGRRVTAMLADLERDLPAARRPALDRFRRLLGDCVAAHRQGELLRIALVGDRQGIGGSHDLPRRAAADQEDRTQPPG